MKYMDLQGRNVIPVVFVGIPRCLHNFKPKLCHRCSPSTEGRPFALRSCDIVTDVPYIILKPSSEGAETFYSYDYSMMKLKCLHF